MRLTQAIAAASMIAAIAAPLAAKPVPAAAPISCNKVLSVAETVWVAEAAAELGMFEGLLNGSFLLTYQPEAGSTGPNLVIKGEDGVLRLWLAGENIVADDGSVTRKLVTIGSEGDGAYAGAKVDLMLSGNFEPEKKGSYELTGSICSQVKRARR